MSIELLRKLGVYIDANFLPDNMCADICGQIDAGAKTDTPLYNEESNENSHLPRLRQSFYSEVPVTTQRAIADRVRLLQPTLERHFADGFDERHEAAKFVLYNEGHFFAPHSDGQLGRKINMSIYLNDEDSADEAADHSGGTLILYGLFANPAFAQKGVGVRGQRGMLIAYPSATVHEVTPVTRGSRYAIITRLLDKQPVATPR